MTTTEQKIDNVDGVRTVHDMRRLRQCAGCTGVGDSEQMVRTEGQLWHTRCYRAHNGFDAVLALPKAQRGKFRLCDLSRREMQKLLMI